MAEKRKGRSGRAFFIVAVLVVFTAIVGTVLGANDMRHLNHLLSRFGYAPVHLPSLAFPWDKTPDLPGDGGLGDIRIQKGLRLPAPRISMPRYALQDLKAPATPFVRAIRMDPQKLCDTLRATGFPQISWTAGLMDGSGSECSAVVNLGKAPQTLPAREEPPPPVAMDAESDGQIAPDDPPPPAQSSVFILLKADARGRVQSFRVKFNIEVEADTPAVIATGSRAIDAFLQQVHWQDDGDMLRKIAALEAFDRDDFGSHIMFKREWGDLPRYNFLARQSEKRRVAIADSFFDPFAWMPVSDAGLSVWMPRSGLRTLPL